jgi:hypothetical protein
MKIIVERAGFFVVENLGICYKEISYGYVLVLGWSLYFFIEMVITIVLNKHIICCKELF